MKDKATVICTHSIATVELGFHWAAAGYSPVSGSLAVFHMGFRIPCSNATILADGRLLSQLQLL